MLPDMQCSEDVEADSSVESYIVNGVGVCTRYTEHVDVCVSSPSKTARLSQSKHRDAADNVALRRLVLVRSGAADCILDDTLDYRLQDLVVLQDDGLTDFIVARVLMRVCYASLTSLHLVDCPLLQLGDETAEMMANLPLRSLVLSRTPQRRLPSAVFRLRCLEVLKVDRNWLVSVPRELGQLTRLRVFSCDGQRPRGLRSLPAAAMRSLGRLQVLSLADNRVETLEPWIGALTQLRVLRARRNRLRHLPASLTDLTRLTIVDVRHNRRLRLNSALSWLFSRLQRFDFDMSATPGRPMRSWCVGDQLTAELNLSRCRRDAVDQSAALGVARDITIAVVGTTNAGKATLMEALCSQRGVCTRTPPHPADTPTNKHGGGGSHRSTSGLDFRHFETKSTDGDEVALCSVSAFVVSSDHAFNYVRQFHVDLYLLVFDLTSFELSPRGGAGTSGNSIMQLQQRQRQQSLSRCVMRLRMWLRALADSAPDTPVILVGTRAAEVNRSTAAVSASPGDVWRSIYETLLHPACATHASCYATRSPNCLLCTSTDLAHSRRTFVKSRHTSAAGFVDLSNHQHNSNDKVILNGYVASVTGHDFDNGDDVTVCDVSSVIRRHNTRSSPSESRDQTQTTTESSGSTLPHVVAYYEIESTKAFPKDARRSGGGNLGVEQLRAAIVRLTKAGDGRDTEDAESTTVPLSWWRLSRHLATVAETDATQPCLPLYDVIAIARSFDVSPRDAHVALRHYARRGRVGIPGRRCSTSPTLVVIYPPWIVETISRVLDTVENSVVQTQDLLQSISDHDVERQLTKASGGETTTSTSGARWLLSSLEHLGVCAPLTPGRAYLFPILLETGSPSNDVWSETPDWNEKQVTCEISIRCPRPAQFAELQVKIGGPQGFRYIAVLRHPAPTFFRHHVVFSTAYDTGPCDDCFRFNRRCRPGSGAATGQQHQRSSAVLDHVLCRSTVGSVDVPANAVVEAGSVLSSAATSALVVHRVRISLDWRVSAISVQVRGPSPCCVMRAVIDFIDCFLDDDPVAAASISARQTIDIDSCSVKTTEQILMNGTAASVSTTKSTWRSRSSTISAYRASYTGSRNSVSQEDASTVLEDDDEPDGMDAINAFNSDAARRRIYVVCPKCILMRNPHPERIEYPSAFCGSASSLLRRRRPICSKWHNLGSWARVITGDYRATSIGLETGAPSWGPASAANGPASNTLSDHDHPRLVVVLPSSVHCSSADWYTAGQTNFLEGYEARFLCEYTGYWHLVDDAVYRFSGAGAMTSSTGGRRRRRPGDQLLAAVLRLALPVIQCLNGTDEHPENARLLASVVTELVDGYDVSVCVDGLQQFDPCAWLTRYKDRIVSVLTKVLVSACEGVVDVHSKTSRSLSAESVFQTTAPAVSPVSRTALARFLRLDATDGRFGGLRAAFVGREVRWVCPAHHVELSAMPSSK